MDELSGKVSTRGLYLGRDALTPKIRDTTSGGSLAATMDVNPCALSPSQLR